MCHVPGFIDGLLQRLIIQFSFNYLSTGRLREVQENFKFLALKVVAVAYERWSLSRGFKYSDLTWRILVFWKIGRRGEVVAYERWSQPEVRLYLLPSVMNILGYFPVLAGEYSVT